jgi:TP901 family phage tail tape measure protein
MKAFSIPSIYTAVDKFTAPLRRMAGASQAFTNTMETGVAKGERIFRKLTPAISETTKQALSFAKATAIAALVFTSINAIKEYETAIASFRTIVGGSDQEFAVYEKAIIDVANQTKKSSVDTAAAFEKIAGLNAKFAETSEGISSVAKAAIVLSKASRDDLGSSAESLVGIMNQFSFGAEQATRTIDVLAAGQAVGAANIKQTSEAFVNFGSVAAGANISLEQSVALIQTLGKFSIFGAEAGTKLRGSLLRLQKSGIGYASGQFSINDALAEAKGKLDKLTTAKKKDAFLNKLFGAENIATGRTLLNNIDLYKDFVTGVSKTGEAEKAAAINSRTLTETLAELSNKWTNIITGSDKTTSSLATAKNMVALLTDNLDLIVSIGSKILVFFLAWKALMVAVRVGLIAYNIVLGITGALSGTASIAIGANAVALGAYKTVLALATAGQWALNIALSANPIGLIIIAIAALIAIIAVAIAYYDKWGAALLLVMGPLGWIVNIIQSFRRNWDMITQAFKEGGIIEGIKAIGVTLLDAVLMPIQQIVQLIAQITGADWASSAVKSIEAYRKGLGVEISAPVNSRATEQQAANDRSESYKQQISLDINNKTGNKATVNTNGDSLVTPNLKSTWMPAFN